MQDFIIASFKTTYQFCKTKLKLLGQVALNVKLLGMFGSVLIKCSIWLVLQDPSH